MSESPTIRDVLEDGHVKVQGEVGGIIHLVPAGGDRTPLCGAEIAADPISVFDLATCPHCLAYRADEVMPLAWRGIWQEALQRLMRCRVDLTQRREILAEDGVDESECGGSDGLTDRSLGARPGS